MNLNRFLNVVVIIFSSQNMLETHCLMYKASNLFVYSFVQDFLNHQFLDICQCAFNPIQDQSFLGLLIDGGEGGVQKGPHSLESVTHILQ